MDQHDQQLLQKQLRAINSAPQQPGAIIVTVLAVFLAGISLGSLLAAGPTSEPTRVAANIVPPYPGGTANIVPPYPGSTLLTMR